MPRAPRPVAALYARHGGLMRDTQRMARTRCYRDGVLTDEDFPLDDVSEHLEDESAMVWVDLLRAGPGATCSSSPTSSACTRSPSRTPPAVASGRSSTATRATTSSPRTPCTSTPRAGELVTGEIAAFITPSALVTVRKDDEFPIDGLLAPVGRQRRPDQVRHRRPRPRPAGLRGRRPLRRRAVPRRRDRAARGPAVRRPPARQGRPAPQLRAAQEPGPPPPGGAADARGRQHADAPRRRAGPRAS